MAGELPIRASSSLPLSWATLTSTTTPTLPTTTHQAAFARQRGSQATSTVSHCHQRA